MVAAGLTFAVLSTTWFSRFFISTPAISSDFYDFCGAVERFRSGEFAYYSQDRSLLAGVIPGSLAKRIGIVDGLAWSAVIASFVLGASLYLWARVAGDRLAGVFAVSLCPSVVSGRR